MPTAQRTQAPARVRRGVAAAVRFAAVALGVGGAPAWAQTAEPNTRVRVQLATVAPPDEPITPGDLLRTTRMFPNWNLNCEVMLSKRHHLCAIEQSVLDSESNPVLTWSIAMGTKGDPVIAIRTAADLDRAYGIKIDMGGLTMALPIETDTCNARSCLIVIPLDATLRAVLAAQTAVRFQAKRGTVELVARGPTAGMSEALTAARADPVGLLAFSATPDRAPAKKKPPATPQLSRR